MKTRSENKDSNSIELQRQTSTATAAAAAASTLSNLSSNSRRRADGSQRRRPSVGALRQVSVRAGSSCMTALGLKAEPPDANEKWNQRRLQLLASYGNLRRPPQLAASATATTESERRPIGRQLSCPTPSRLRLLSGLGTPLLPTEQQQLGRPPPPSAPPRNAASFDNVDFSSPVSFKAMRQQQQQLLRRDSAIRCLYRGVRSLSSGGSGTPSSAAKTPKRIDGDDAQDVVQLPTVPEEPGNHHPTAGRDFVDAASEIRVESAEQPSRSSGNVFVLDFNQRKEELEAEQRERELLMNQLIEQRQPEFEPGPTSLLDRLRLSCLTNTETAELKAEIDHHLLFRPYFTYWITCVHCIIFIATVVQFGFAPFGVTLLSTRSATVVNRNMLQAKVCAIDYHNLFIGPRMSDLIRVGAKYSLCMRRYDALYTQILDRQRLNESNSGCCVHNDGSACFQSQQSGCPKQLGVWLKWSNNNSDNFGLQSINGRQSGPVCGQDPRTCLEPLSLEHDHGGSSWPDDISQWPACRRHKQLNVSLSNPLESLQSAHLVCPISARPCCVGIKGECVITSQQRCKFMRGTFFPDRQLCSQVNCMSETCGMLGVSDPERPNQFYRVLTSLFLHSGLVTLAVTLMHHLLFLRRLEQSFGWHRTALIYLGSGVVGNLVSMIFLPYLVDVGPTSAQIGSLAPILIELAMSWNYYESKTRPVCIFVISPLVLVLFGFFPWFDNFANLGGLISGLLLSVVLMPYVNLFDSPNAALRCRRISVAICLLAWLLLLGGLFCVFYLAPLTSCDFCVYFNCGPKWFDGYFTDQSHVDYCGNVNLSNLEPTRCVESLSHQLT